MKKSVFFIWGILVVLLFTACPNEAKDLPVKTILWQPDGSGFTQFYTNDPEEHGYNFWTHVGTVTNDTFEIELKRISGYNGMNYGMIFGADNTVNDSGNRRHYSLVITNTGYYRIFSRDGGTVTNITGNAESPWIQASINAGNNQINKLKVTRSGNEYTVYINNTEVEKFTDVTVTGGNRIGFYASVGTATDEDFPNNPVDLRFRRIP